jgi:hypothetical protein
VEVQSQDVVILGAGFSKAVHDSFPLLSELAARVFPYLKENAAPSVIHLVEELQRDVVTTQQISDSGRGSDFDFEAWLARIAIDQPHLSIAENLERRALFARATLAIRDVLLEAQREAFESELPNWLCQLIYILHIRRSTVITMNYDTVIETEVPRLLRPWLRNDGGVMQFCASDLFDGIPPTYTTPEQTFLDSPVGEWGKSPRQTQHTFRLIKLHGSLDWFAAPNDSTGATLIRLEHFKEDSNEEANNGLHPPGREPYIIPPDANKSPYFVNPIVREMWSMARTALERAKRVILVGYSLPATDTTFGGLLADTIGRRRRDVDVTVVDLDPDSVAERLEKLGISPTCKIGDSCPVETWTGELVDNQAKEATKLLRKLASNSRCDEKVWDATLPSPDSKPTYVMPGELIDDTFVLYLRRSQGPVVTAPEERYALTDFLPPKEINKVVVRLEDGSCHPILDASVCDPDEPWNGILELRVPLAPEDYGGTVTE